MISNIYDISAKAEIIIEKKGILMIVYTHVHFVFPLTLESAMLSSSIFIVYTHTRTHLIEYFSQIWRSLLPKNIHSWSDNSQITKYDLQSIV